MAWRLAGYDPFANEWYDYPGETYASRTEAEAAAQRALQELERTQPTAQSGGQTGIQDRVYIVHPDGTRSRVLPE
jgi:uncharacterized protein involved in type VI secretion and phage assembly